MKLTWIDKTVIYIILSLIIFIASVIYLSHNYILELGNILTITSFLFLTVSAILLYFQIRTGLSFNKRKAAFDFIMKDISKDLIALFKELSQITRVPRVQTLYKTYAIKDILDGKVLISEELPEFETKVIAILNFYERMAIGIYTGVLDNSICYDDTGFNLIKFFEWVEPYIKILQGEYKEERLFANFLDLYENWHKFYIKIKEKNRKQSKKFTRNNIIRSPKI